MFKVFLHVSCITILEICFFFYYIGPLETDIFYSYIKRIISGPLEQLDNTLEKWNISRKQFIEELYSQSTDSDFENKLEREKDYGKMQRDEDNRQLFFNTIEYWSCILAFTFFLYLCEWIYNYHKMKDLKNIVPYEDEYTEN